MTAVETVETLQTSELVGFNLAMAREDVCAAIMHGEAHPDRAKVLTNFVDAMHEALFGEHRLVTTETVDEVSELLRRQLACLVSEELVTVELITERVEDYAMNQPLPAAVEYTIEDIVGPLLWRAAQKP